jgi:hypothetical protein
MKVLNLAMFRTAGNMKAAKRSTEWSENNDAVGNADGPTQFTYVGGTDELSSSSERGPR